jgi:peptidoglycan/xylan/chitin deacetylase (PgdA/CDA1 family)
MQQRIWGAALAAVTGLAVLVVAPRADATEPTPVADNTVVAPATTPSPTTPSPTTDAASVDTTPPVLGVTLSSPVISPNGDGRLDRLTVQVTVDEAVALSATVRNPVGGGYASLATDRPGGPGSVSVVWLGRLRRGDGSWATAANGRMVIEVEAVDGAANNSSTARSVVVATRAPALSQGPVSPEPWTGRGALTQHFSTSDPSRPLTMWTRVLRDGRVVDQSPPRHRPASTHTIRWYPDAWGRALPIGLHQAEVVVRDAAGNTSRRSVPFRVHRVVATQRVSQVAGAGRRVAITIDDCYDAGAWSSMLSTLDRLDAGATFFCNGEYVRRFAAVARRTVATDGVSIGSHTVGHADLATVGFSGALYRMLGDEAAWWDVARATPAPFLRPPYGSYSSEVLAAAGRASFAYTVLWDIDPRDWDVGDPGTVVSRVLSGAKGGSIILLHTRSNTARALEAIILGLRARGLQPVGLHQMLG